MKPKLVVLGSSGLLGASVAKQAFESGIEAIEISRATVPKLELQLRNVGSLFSELGIGPHDTVVNAIGVTRQKISNNSTDLRRQVEWLNSDLPRQLGLLRSEGKGPKIYQVGTDCVFSGKRGRYIESDAMDAEDVYGVTKANGEMAHGITVIRASFVGYSNVRNPYLWNWVHNYPKKRKIPGFTNQIWNGVTNQIHAKILVGFHLHEEDWGITQHLVPIGKVTKAELVSLLAKKSNRSDLDIELSEAEQAKDLSLGTADQARNKFLWTLAGYADTPCIEQIINDYKI